MPTEGPLFTDRDRAESFGTVAANYDRYRPSYPAAMIGDLAALGARSVLDVGCGTGKAAVLLAARGLDVLGVEIDPMMAEVARANGIPVEVSSFEGWDDAGRRFDLLTCAQAWHWVDPSRGVPKAAQLVRPGGAVALFWNHDELSDDAQRALDEAYSDHAPELLKNGPHDVDDRPHVEPFDASTAFASVETRHYEWQRSFTADEWVGMCLTQSDHVLLPDARRASWADAARTVLEQLGGVTARYGTYLVLAHRAR